MQSKVSLRQAMKDRLQSMKDYERRVESANIVRNLEALMKTEGNGIIGIFVPYIDEPNILPLLEKMLCENKKLCMPAIDGNRLRMCEVQELKTISRNPLTKIFEPALKKWVDESKISLVIVPGRGFTRSGDRLGRGNGGYDYWISAQRKRNPSTKIIGICFDCQIVMSIPMEAHDETVDQVISATKRSDEARSD